jgi:prevent-host-death family protein
MHISIVDAKERLLDLVTAVEDGGEVVLTRNGVPVARLVPVPDGFDRARARETADGLMAASRGLSLGGVPIRDLVGEGRS